MDDRLTQALALLIGTLSSVVLMWGQYRFGGRKYRDQDDPPDHDHHDDD